MKRVKIGDRIGEYIVSEKKGEGGFGEVWKAHHHYFKDDFVAIKIPTDEKYVELLRNEGSIQHNLDHPNIVKTKGFDPFYDPPYIMMEYISGENLREVLNKQGKLNIDAALEVAFQIFDALEYAHSKGIIHQDLKPENILITTSEKKTPFNKKFFIKISDFGLGKVTSATTNTIYLSGMLKTAKGISLSGTLVYMSPEQKKVSGKIDNRSDIYSAGIILYEMLTGELPEGAFKYPSEINNTIPVYIDWIIRGCLIPRSEDRYKNAGEIKSDIVSIVQGLEPNFCKCFAITQKEETTYSYVKFVEPFCFSNGREARNVKELVEISDEDRKIGKFHLYNGDIETWLRRIGEKELSRYVWEIREQITSPDVGLEMFISKVGVLPLPILDVDIENINLGEVERGLMKSTRIYITNRGRGYLYGKIRSIVPWVKILTENFEGNDVAVDIVIDTSRFQFSKDSSKTIAGEIEIDSNGGKKNIVVSFSLVPKPANIELKEPELTLFSTGKVVYKSLLLVNNGDEGLSCKVIPEDDWLELTSDAEEISVIGNTYVGFKIDVKKALKSHNVKFRSKLDIVESNVKLIYKDATKQDLVEINVPVTLKVIKDFNLSYFILGLVVSVFLEIIFDFGFTFNCIFTLLLSMWFISNLTITSDIIYTGKVGVKQYINRMKYSSFILGALIVVYLILVVVKGAFNDYIDSIISIPFD